MVDIAWLPSAVMQTIGAMYAILVASIVFLLQWVGNRGVNQKLFSTAHAVIIAFLGLSVVVFFTLCYNCMLLFLIMNGDVDFENMRYFAGWSLLTWSLVTFLISAAYVIVFAGAVVIVMIKDVFDIAYGRYNKQR